MNERDFKYKVKNMDILTNSDDYLNVENDWFDDLH